MVTVTKRACQRNRDDPARSSYAAKLIIDYVILIVAIALAVYGAISVIYGLASVMAARHG